MGATPKDAILPSWKLKLAEIDGKEINTIKDHASQLRYGEKEVGMRHPGTQSHIKIFDNGNIEMFAGDTAGVVISDVYDTLNLYGNAVNVNTYNMNVMTRPYGFTWNGFVWNPQLYNLYDQDFQLDGSVRYWVEATDTTPGHWARRRVSVKPLIKASHSAEFNSLLAELGIPT